MVRRNIDRKVHPTAKKLSADFCVAIEALGGHALRISPDTLFSTGPGRIGNITVARHRDPALGLVILNGDIPRRVSKLIQQRLDLRSPDGTFGPVSRSVLDTFPGKFECYRPHGGPVEFRALLSELQELGSWLAGWIWSCEHGLPNPEPPFPFASRWEPTIEGDLGKSNLFWSKAGWDATGPR